MRHLLRYRSVRKPNTDKLKNKVNTHEMGTRRAGGRARCESEPQPKTNKTQLPLVSRTSTAIFSRVTHKGTRRPPVTRIIGVRGPHGKTIDNRANAGSQASPPFCRPLVEQALTRQLKLDSVGS
ncbi:hypothetical protein ACJJTC_014800 [Scirpophaga incertulas]